MFLRTVSVSLETYLPSALYPEAHDISLNSWTLSLRLDNLFNKAFSGIFPEKLFLTLLASDIAMHTGSYVWSPLK